MYRPSNSPWSRKLVKEHDNWRKKVEKLEVNVLQLSCKGQYQIHLHDNWRKKVEKLEGTTKVVPSNFSTFFLQLS